MVKMVLGSSDGQANSVSSLASNRMAAFQSTMDALTNFIATTNLTGNAYGNAQQYAQSTLIPLLQAAILYEENLSTAVGKIPSEYRNTEHLGEDLDSEELEEELQALDMTRSSLMESIRVSEQHDLNGSTLNSNGRNTQSLRGQLRTVNQRREKIMQQLAALAAYSATSVTFFDGLTEVPSDLKSALAMVSGDMSSFSGEFPERKDIEWVQNVASTWSKREEKQVKVTIEYVEEAYDKGQLTESDYNSIKSGLLNGGIAFLNEILKGEITDEVIEKISQKALNWLSQSVYNMNYGAVAQYAGGGIATGSVMVSPTFVKFLGTASRYAAPVIGGLVDYSMQVARGENRGDAAVKATAHVVIGTGAAVVGKATGSAVTALAASTVLLAPVAPFLGVATDFVVTSTLTIAGSWLFDTVYDNRDEIVKTVSDGLEDIGNSISGAISDLGTALGW